MTDKIRSRAINALDDEARTKLRLRANNEVYLRATAVIQQVRRLRKNDQPAAEYMADMWLLAHAIRGTLKFGEFCLELSEESPNLKAAIENFRNVVPDAVALRDVLEHFDDYLLGIGRNKKISSEPIFFFERGESARIRVENMVIDMEVAEQASIALASAALVGDRANPA